MQSDRLPLYQAALARLHEAGLIFPCHRSRKDLAGALSAPARRPRAERRRQAGNEPGLRPVALAPADDEPHRPATSTPPGSR
ncbi:MAG: hypothetical protein QM765_11485 [Myxococcales bacterium]